MHWCCIGFLREQIWDSRRTRGGVALRDDRRRFKRLVKTARASASSPRPCSGSQHSPRRYHYCSIFDNLVQNASQISCSTTREPAHSCNYVQRDTGTGRHPLPTRPYARPRLRHRRRGSHDLPQSLRASGRWVWSDAGAATRWLVRRRRGIGPRARPTGGCALGDA
jgi:hypothetical protein